MAMAMLDWPTFVLQRRVNQPLGAVEQVLCDPFLTPAAFELGTDAVHEELQARLRAVLPQLIGRIEDAHHGFGQLEVLGDRHPVAQHDRVPGRLRIAQVGEPAVGRSLARRLRAGRRGGVRRLDFRHPLPGDPLLGFERL